MLGTEREEARKEHTMKIFGMGMPELILILVVVLIIFGPKNLPKLGGMLGRSVKKTRSPHAVHRKPLEETGAFSYGEGSCMANRRFAPSNRPSRTNARTLASR